MCMCACVCCDSLRWTGSRGRTERLNHHHVVGLWTACEGGTRQYKTGTPFIPREHNEEEKKKGFTWVIATSSRTTGRNRSFRLHASGRIDTPRVPHFIGKDNERLLLCHVQCSLDLFIFAALVWSRDGEYGVVGLKEGTGGGDMWMYHLMRSRSLGS